MKLRNLSVLLFAAACGGGGDDGPTPLDTPTGDGGGFFPNSRNDVFYVTFTDTLTADLTPDTGDAPDNDTPFNIGQTGGTGIAGEFGIAGDQGDSYKERDTYLLSTGAAVNELTVRMDWDGGDADLDYLVYFEPEATDTEFPSLASGSGVHNGTDADGNPLGEFTTFTVDPSDNYLLWAGVFAENAPPGGSPTLPKPYDLSVYGVSFTTASVAGTCDHTETADATNNAITRFGGTGTREATAVNLTGTKLFCGTLQPKTPVADPANAEVSTEDVDVFQINVPVAGDFIIRVIGETEADQTAINTLLAKGALQAGVMNEACQGANCPDLDPNTAGTQKRLEQFWGLATDTGTHGVDAFAAEDSAFDPDETPTVVDVQGPKTVAIFVRSSTPGGACEATNECGPALTAPIKYRIQVIEDNRNTSTPRKTGDQIEMNDNTP